MYYRCGCTSLVLSNTHCHAVVRLSSQLRKFAKLETFKNCYSRKFRPSKILRYMAFYSEQRAATCFCFVNIQDSSTWIDIAREGLKESSFGCPPPPSPHTPLSTKDNIDATSSSHSDYGKTHTSSYNYHTFVHICVLCAYIYIHTYNMITYIESQQAALFGFGSLSPFSS